MPRLGTAADYGPGAGGPRPVGGPATAPPAPAPTALASAPGPPPRARASRQPFFEDAPALFCLAVWAALAAAGYAWASRLYQDELAEWVAWAWVGSGAADTVSLWQWHLARVWWELRASARALLPDRMEPAHYVLYGAVGAGLVYMVVLPLGVVLLHSAARWAWRRLQGIPRALGAIFRAPLAVARVVHGTPLSELATTGLLLVGVAAVAWLVLGPPIVINSGPGWGPGGGPGPGAGRGRGNHHHHSHHHSHHHHHHHGGGGRQQHTAPPGPPPTDFGAAYRRMGLARGSASLDDAKRAFRRLALELHPDKNPGDEAAAEEFLRVQEAYEAVMEDLGGGAGAGAAEGGQGRGGGGGPRSQRGWR